MTADEHAGQVPTVTLVGYARVSTLEQVADLQHDALTKAGCERIYTDHASGSTTSRPELDACMDYLRSGDTLVVWRFDRLGRSIRHLLDVVAGLDERGIGLRSLTEDIDTNSPGGRLIFHVMAAIAEFERNLNRERTKAGLAAARARGNGGRKSATNASQKREIIAMRARGTTVMEIHRVTGVSRATVYRVLESTQEEAKP